MYTPSLQLWAQLPQTPNADEPIHYLSKNFIFRCNGCHVMGGTEVGAAAVRDRGGLALECKCWRLRGP